jgi:hypothetical protein
VAVLTEPQRTRIWRSFAKIAASLGPLAWNKDDLRTAADATNNWLDAAQTSFNNALNTNAPAFGSTATARQKALMLVYVLLVRANLVDAVLED